MRNPFEELGGTQLDDPKGEEVEGAFSCQMYPCREVNNTARYLDEAKILTWVCAEGHISRLEGFHID